MAKDDDERDRPPTLEEAEADKKRLTPTNVVNLFPTQPKVSPDPKDECLVLNQWYATVIKDGKFKVIWERDDSIIFMDKKDFMDSLAHQKVLIVTSDPNGNQKSKHEPIAKLWLEHHKHRQYRITIFDLKNPFSIDDLDYNIFRGFVIKSKKGSCYKFLMYVKNILCRGNKSIFRWKMAWTSHIMQRPWEKPETAIAIHGEEEGTGKSFFPMILSKLLDGKNLENPHKLYFKTSNAKMITGDFSGHLEHCLLLHAEEAFRAESEREDSIIKDLITGGDIGINPKNIAAKISKSYLRLILTGNPPHIVKAGRFARRFLVLKISDKYRMNIEYFREILNELDNGGYEALMHYLMHYPIDKFNLREAPATEWLGEQKIDSAKPAEKLWYNTCYTAELSFKGMGVGKHYGSKEPEHLVIKHKMTSLYQRFVGRKPGKNRSDEVEFGKAFVQLFPMIDDNGKIIKDRSGKPMKFLQDGKYQGDNCYIIPSLKLCRRMLDAYFGQSLEWPENNEWELKPYDYD